MIFHLLLFCFNQAFKKKTKTQKTWALQTTTPLHFKIGCRDKPPPEQHPPPTPFSTPLPSKTRQRPELHSAGSHLHVQRPLHCLRVTFTLPPPPAGHADDADFQPEQSRQTFQNGIKQRSTTFKVPGIKVSTKTKR